MVLRPLESPKKVAALANGAFVIAVCGGSTLQVTQNTSRTSAIVLSCQFVLVRTYLHKEACGTLGSACEMACMLSPTSSRSSFHPVA